MKKVVAEINSDFPEIQSLVEEIISHGVPDSAQVIYSGRNNVYKLDWHGVDVCIKAFKAPSLVNSYVYTHLRESKARRSYTYARRLNSLGIDSPTQLAYIEVLDDLRLKESYYISRFVTAQTVRNWEERADCDQMLSALAQEMVKIHRAGVLHKDFSPGNILVSGNAQDGYHFCLVDINRMKFDVHDFDKLMSNFRNLHLDPDQIARLARHYAHAAGLDEQTIERIARSQLSSYKRSKRIIHLLKLKR